MDRAIKEKEVASYGKRKTSEGRKVPKKQSAGTQGFIRNNNDWKTDLSGHFLSICYSALYLLVEGEDTDLMK